MESSNLTEQLYFDTAINHLRNQKTRCADSDGIAILADGKGNTDTLGLRIPKDHPALQDARVYSAETLAAHHPELAGLAWPCSPNGLELARELQSLHDWQLFRLNETAGGLSPRGEVRANQIAKQFGLTYRAPEETVSPVFEAQSLFDATLNVLRSADPEAAAVRWSGSGQIAAVAADLFYLRNYEACRGENGFGLSREGERFAEALAEDHGLSYSPPTE